MNKLTEDSKIKLITKIAKKKNIKEKQVNEFELYT